MSRAPVRAAPAAASVAAAVAVCAVCAVALLAAAPPARAEGCPCEPLTLVESLDDADAFFIGVVTGISPVGPHPDVWHGVDAQRVTFEVALAYQADLDVPLVSVVTPAKVDDCGFPFALGDAYYVLAIRGSQSAELVVMACSGTFSLSDPPENGVFDADVLTVLSTMTPAWMDESVMERWVPQPQDTTEAIEPASWPTPTMWDRAVEYPGEYPADEWAFPPVATESLPSEILSLALTPTPPGAPLPPQPGSDVRRLPYLPLTLALAVAVAVALAWWLVRSTR